MKPGAALLYFQPVRQELASMASLPINHHGILVPSLKCLCKSMYLAFAMVALLPGTICAREASTSEEFAINLWSKTCAVAYGDYGRFAKIAQQYNFTSVYDEGQRDLMGAGGLAWSVKSREFGTYILAWRISGACLISTDKSNAENAEGYFDEIVAKSVPKEWKVDRSVKTLSNHSDRLTYRITSGRGRKIEYEILTSSREGDRQLVIYTKYQQPGEVWTDW